MALGDAGSWGLFPKNSWRTPVQAGGLSALLSLGSPRSRTGHPCLDVLKLRRNRLESTHERRAAVKTLEDATDCEEACPFWCFMSVRDSTAQKAAGEPYSLPFSSPRTISIPSGGFLGRNDGYILSVDVLGNADWRTPVQPIH